MKLSFVMFNSEKRKKRKSSKKADTKLRPNYFIAIQITNKDVSDIKILETICI